MEGTGAGTRAEELKELLRLVRERDDLAQLDPPARRLALRSLVRSAGVADVAAAVRSVADAVDGYGPLSELMTDEVSDVLVNGPHEVWVERSGRLEPTEVEFADEEELRALMDRLLANAGVALDLSHPAASARLPDGSRIHAILPPLAPRGPLVSIRRFPSRPSLQELQALGTLSQDQHALLVDAVRRRLTTVISGGTGSGKTTLMNALLSEVGDEERVVIVEETPELAPLCRHAVSLVTRDANLEGRGLVDLRALVRSALRMRPDRIVIGEVRGAEALDAVMAMATGHEGSMLTVHASSPEAARERLVMLALLASPARDDALRAQVDEAVGLFVHLDRDDRGARRVRAITASR